MIETNCWKGVVMLGIVEEEDSKNMRTDHEIGQVYSRGLWESIKMEGRGS